MENVRVVHAGEEPPEEWTASVFLAGPTPRSPDVGSWRPEAVAELARRWQEPGRLVVFVPEPRDAVWPEYDDQRTWELYWGDRCDVVMFWIPRTADMLALTTNDEFGRWKDTGRVVLGTPPGALRVRYQRGYATDRHIPLSDTLTDTIDSALAEVGAGAERAGGCRHVPLLLWRTPSFQSWFQAQQEVGNELRAARLEWTFRIGKQLDKVFFWALHVEVYVRAEDRVKDNEVVFSRPDISSVLAYRRGATAADTEIVVVREFRTTSSSSDGFVLELPGGSHPEPIDPAELALIELEEETGLTVAPERLVRHRARQLAATVTAHRQHLFSVELTEEEMATVRSSAARGVLANTEITYPQTIRLGDLMTDDRADWTTLGAVAEVLLG